MQEPNVKTQNASKKKCGNIKITKKIPQKVKDSNNKVEIIYMRNGKKHNMVVIVNELIVDQMVKAYKIFFSESMKKLNEINY